MATQNLQTRSGNRVVIMMDGKQIGAMQSVRMSDDYSPEPASGIGDIHMFEYVPSAARHNLSVSNMVLKKNSLRSLGIFPENGDGALLGLVFDVMVLDKDDGSLLRKYTGASYASGELEISKHSIIMTSGTLNALDVTGTGA